MASNYEKLPWFSRQDAQQIVSALSSNHAVLLNGVEGIGKSYFAFQLIKTLYAGSTSAAKHLLDAGTHPDVHLLTSPFAYKNLDANLKKFSARYLYQDALEKKRLSRQIGVDTIRALIQSMNDASSSSICKVAIIHPAEHMNINSANAILKFLEEPPPRTLLVLISHDISKLTATIRSRCMRINISPPDKEVSARWLASLYPDRSESEHAGALELAAFRPLAAAAYLSGNQLALVADLESDIAEIAFNHTANIVLTARKWTRYRQTDFILGWLCQFMTVLIKTKLLGYPVTDNSPENRQLGLMSKSFSAASLFAAYDYLTSVKQGYDGVVDEALVIEDMLQTVANSTIHHSP